MAVVLATSTQRYVGLSSDTKPATARAGALFYETDSGLTSIWDGSAWQPRYEAGPFKATKTVTFTGAATLGQAGTTTTWFTITGTVLIERLVPVCTVNLGEALATATITLGVTDATAFFNAATNSVDIDAGDFWFDATPTEVNALAVPAGFKDIAIIDDDIVSACATQNTNAGAIRIDVYWRPLSATGLLVPA